jgi:hypothetical protein
MNNLLATQKDNKEIFTPDPKEQSHYSSLLKGPLLNLFEVMLGINIDTSNEEQIILTGINSGKAK